MNKSNHCQTILLLKKVNISHPHPFKAVSNRYLLKPKYEGL